MSTMDHPQVSGETPKTERDIDYDFCSDTESEYDVLEDSASADNDRSAMATEVDDAAMATQVDGAAKLGQTTTANMPPVSLYTLDHLKHGSSSARFQWGPQITKNSEPTSTHKAVLAEEKAEVPYLNLFKKGKILLQRPTYEQLTAEIQYFISEAGVVDVAPSLSPLGCSHSVQAPLRMYNTEFVCDGCARAKVGDMNKCCQVLSLSGRIMECQDWLCKSCAQYFDHTLSIQPHAPQNEQELYELIGCRNRTA